MRTLSTNKGARPMEVESLFDRGKPPDVGLCPYTACGALATFFLTAKYPNLSTRAFRPGFSLFMN
jgi:hypothetical protein